VKALNSPIEVGVRILVLLVEVFPSSLDIGHLVFCDHALLHSADLGGPSSIHPKLPASPGELGLKRGLVESGLQVLIRAGLAEMVIEASGIAYRGTEESAGFVEILESSYLHSLKERVNWVAGELAYLTIEELRSRMSVFFSQWSEEFFEQDKPLDVEGPAL
jgi:hypothetical protein